MSTRSLLFLFLLSGCAAPIIPFMRTNTAAGPHKNQTPGAIQVVTQVPSQAHLEIGVFRFMTQGAGAVPNHEVLSRLRERAAQEGCDGIVVPANFVTDPTTLFSGETNATCYVSQ